MQYAFADFIVDSEQHELRRRGKLIKLRPKVFQTLLYLLEHSHRVVSKDELHLHLWPRRFVSDSNLSSCLKELRKALGDSGRGSQRMIATVHGRGYRFIHAVEQLPPAAFAGLPAQLLREHDQRSLAALSERLAKSNILPRRVTSKDVQAVLHAFMVLYRTEIQRLQV